MQIKAMDHTQAFSKFLRHGFGSCGVKLHSNWVVGVDVVGERSGEHLVGSIAEELRGPSLRVGKLRGCIYENHSTCKQNRS